MTERDIIRDAAMLYGCDTADLTSRKRHRKLVDARKVSAYILCALVGLPYSEVGRMLNRTHAAVIYFERQAEGWLHQPRLNPEGAARIRYIAKKYNIKL